MRALRQSVESNRTALRATEAGFEVGTQTTVDVLHAQNNLRRAETTYSRSRYDYILNVLRLKQAAGTLVGSRRRASRRLVAVALCGTTASAATPR